MRSWILLPVFTAFILLHLSCRREEATPTTPADPSPLSSSIPTREKEPDFAKLSAGSSRSEVLEVLGEPSGEMTIAGVQTLYFDGVGLEFKNGMLVQMPEDLQQAMTEARTKERIRLEEAAKKAEAAKAAPKGNRVIRDGGQRIDLGALVGNGSITLVDFFADWCGPCRQMEPHLKKLAEDPNVNLIQIDIVNWEKPINQQYGIRSIPDVRVFDAQGKQVGKGTYDLRKIQANLKKAKDRS